ncbi:MAG: RluA family pseudouridine synthase [Planctomycetota bacterium]|jgi:23S rRNA-/tRNA-specific pseudouridylate synthase
MKLAIEIIYEDGDILVINKPSGVSVTADRSGGRELVELLTGQLGPQQANQLRLIHRLESRFTSCFEKRLVKKTYLALVTGPVPGREGSIDAPLSHSRKKPQLMCIDRKRGKEAVTNWKLLADFGSIALLAVSPLTGRTHQIRIHLPSIGLPLAIDPLYGSSKPLYLSDFKPNYRLGKGRIEKPLIDRLTLHAYELDIPSNRPDTFIAGLDKRFTAALKMLTKHNPKGTDAFLNPDDLAIILNGCRLDRKIS